MQAATLGWRPRGRGATASVAVAGAIRFARRDDEPQRRDENAAPGPLPLGLRVDGVPLRVLVVEDEPSIRLVCAINLELAGFEVVEAGDGADALRRARAEQFDLVLLDVMLPDMGGHEVARQLVADERTVGVPIVFLSARTDRDDLRAGFELGAVDYVTKPFDPIGLAGRVREAIDRVARGEADAMRQRSLAELEHDQGP